MKMIIFWVILIGAVWLLQTYLGMKQMKNFHEEFIQMSKIGKTAIGKSKGMFFKGCIIVLVLDKYNTIKQGKIIEGVTIFARTKDFNDFNGLKLSELEYILDDLKLDYSRKKALKSIFTNNIKK